TESLTSAAGPAAPAHAGADAAPPSFAAALAQALPGSTATAPGAADAPVAAHAHIQAPLHGSTFAPEIGARVSLMAVDGIQQAELQLNPADMGPVAVQIVVDGSQAQVSFHAAQAETRQALEQSLPDLAAALQGQGLTLSGGGVFQQAPRDGDTQGEARGGDEAAGSRTAGVSRAGGGSGGGAASAPKRSVGLLDTFA
ncbi:flagellar hook-length control protein FliK, partial [Roseateles sp.]|uniref:flagellar hook-length control protein FliK n=1 Tax=Roseateles sp. TaxID=1971397 RepID=UPI002E094ED6|nr:flagellar hook-length control protein FliK [Roseateles sp.]